MMIKGLLKNPSSSGEDIERHNLVKCISKLQARFNSGVYKSYLYF